MTWDYAMIQMFRADLPRAVPAVVATDGADLAIIVNRNYLGGDTQSMRHVVNLLLASLASMAAVGHLAS